MCSTIPIFSFNFWVIFILSFANAFNLDISKILSFGKELNNLQAFIYVTVLGCDHFSQSTSPRQFTSYHAQLSHLKR